MAMLGRRKTREAAFKLLYSYTIQKDDRELQFSRVVDETPIKGRDLEFFRALVDGVTATMTTLDAAIEPCLRNWRLTRLPCVDLTILRLGVYELLYRHDIPQAATINECVRLAKTYSTDEARRYINGVLGSLARQMAAGTAHEDNKAPASDVETNDVL